MYPPLYLSLFISIFSLIICIISFFYFKSYLKRRTSHERILSEMREEVNFILKSINETTDRDISLIEDREKRLKNLLENIEKRLKVYIREMERFGSQTIIPQIVVPSDINLNAGSANAETPIKKTYEELGKKRYSLKKPEEITAYPIPDFEVKTEAEAPIPQPPSIGEQIRSLLRSGFSVQAVASRLKISVSEVEFAAALLERREKKETNGN